MKKVVFGILFLGLVGLGFVGCEKNVENVRMRIIHKNADKVSENVYEFLTFAKEKELLYLEMYSEEIVLKMK